MEDDLEWSVLMPRARVVLRYLFPRTLRIEDSTITLQGKVTVRLDKQE